MKRGRANAVLVAASVAVLIVYLILIQDRLPDEVATHWGANGEADQFTARASLPWLFGGFTALIGFVMTVVALSAPRQAVAGTRLLSGTPLATVWFMAAIAYLTVSAQLDGAGPVAPSGQTILAALGAGLAGGLVGVWIAGPAAPIPEEPRLTVTDPESLTWRGRTPRTLLMPTIATVVAVGGIALAYATRWQLLLLFAPIVLLVAVSSSFNVSAGPKGVVVAAVGIGFPRVRVPLEQIAGVEVGTVEAWNYGGWGIRLGPDTAVITKSGPALIVRRTDGAGLRISLDRPEEPAAALASLLPRRR